MITEDTLQYRIEQLTKEVKELKNKIKDEPTILKLYTLDNQFIKEVGFGWNPSNFTGIVDHEYHMKEWLLNGKLHRLDGPAVEFWDTNEEHHDLPYWINGVNLKVTKSEFEKITSFLKNK